MVRITDRKNMTSAVYLGVKAKNQTNKFLQIFGVPIFWSLSQGTLTAKVALNDPLYLP